MPCCPAGLLACWPAGLLACWPAGLLACYVGSGARASELLGVRLEDVDWSVGRLWVITKGTGLRRPGARVPAGVRLHGCLPGPGRAARAGRAALADPPG
ncbi:hypothetical protein GCM10010305_59390 [Streptomyces termitum]|uniref:Uncharacterized protein n=1 Tax=Streptomyces termitum TaxID=67368 RepID=A0A918T909_9ACTN|nr:hypothetical protein GCM10010305_59390 [Streptomyces termitum]